MAKETRFFPKRPPEELIYRHYKRAVLYKYSFDKPSRRITTVRKGEVILPTTLVYNEDKFNGGDDVFFRIGTKEDPGFIGSVAPASTNVTGLLPFYESETGELKVWDRPADIYFIISGDSTTGKGYMLMEILNTNLVEQP